MTIEGDLSNRKSFYSVECNTCFNPVSEQEPIFLARPSDRLGHHQAFQVARAHELELGEDHRLVLAGWGSYNLSKMPQVKKDNDRIRFDKELRAVGKKLNNSYYCANVARGDYEVSLVIDNEVRTFSFPLTPDEIDKSPESVVYLFERLGIARSDETHISLRLCYPEAFSIVINPQITDERLGIALNSGDWHGITCAEDNEVKTYYLEDYGENLPQRVRNFMETYWLIDDSLISQSPLMHSTVVDTAHWMDALFERRRKIPQKRLVYDISKSSF